MSAAPRKFGFTLVELMIVVLVISVLAAAFAPSIRRTVLEQRGGSAAREFVRIIRDARVRTMADRRARMVYVDPGSDSVRVLTSRTISCQTENWVAANDACTLRVNATPFITTEPACTTLLLGRHPWSVTGSNTMDLNELDGAGTPISTSRRICFSPNGVVWHQPGDFAGAALTNLNTVQGGFVYQLAILRPGESSSPLPPRQVLVPLNGLARVLR